MKKPLLKFWGPEKTHWLWVTKILKIWNKLKI